MDKDWILTERRLPTKNERVDWISPCGIQVNSGTFIGGAVWFLPGSEVHIYYLPIFWRPARGTES